jgi:methyltransferase (TIGR00027 family)
MQELVASHTALAVALMRSLHARVDPQPLIHDPWGDRLVPELVIEAVHALVLAASSVETAGASSAVSAQSAETRASVDRFLRASPAYASVILRTRYTEEALHAAVARGVRQYVMIGAGFDSYALRRPPEAEHVVVYEVDHPATQALKRRRLTDCGVSLPPTLHFLAADLAKESLGGVLSRSSFRANEPAFFSWLGVTMYLTRAANLESLRAIAESGAPGSQLVFTYLDDAVFRQDGVPATFRELQQAVSAVGEPFVSGFEPHRLAHELREIGFDLEEDVEDAELVERYDPAGANDLRPAPRSRIARARIVKGQRVRSKSD